jgi:thioredoxin 1
VIARVLPFIFALLVGCAKDTEQSEQESTPLEPRFAKLLRFPTDAGAFAEAAEKGHAVFYDHACWRCHALGDEEPPGNPDFENSGPDLSAVGSRLTTAEILQSIVDPNVIIADPAGDHTSSERISKMPPFGEAIPENELRNLLIFLGENKVTSEDETGLIVTVTDANFNEEVVAAREPILLLDFWAEWCIPCLELNPVLEKIAPDFRGKVKICKVEVDGNPDVVTEYAPDNIFPFLVLMQQGEVIDQKTGTDPKMDPEEFMRKWLGEALRENTPSN